jgi:hypothetical protein
MSFGLVPAISSDGCQIINKIIYFWQAQKDNRPMKKIGILSMQKVMNHGSFLQAYSLMSIIKQLRPDYEVLFIDIKPGINLYPKNEKQYALKKFYKRLNQIKKISAFKKRIFNEKRKWIFRKIWRQYLGITDSRNWDIHFDTIVIGSDEVFNCLQDAEWGFAANLLGEGMDGDKIITYAASCGHTTAEQVFRMNIAKDVIGALKHIEVFSVRDINTQEFVKKLVRRDALTHLDPVFLFDFVPYMVNNKARPPFILLYAYEDRFNDRDEIDAIVSFSKKMNMEIISVLGHQEWCKNNLILSPFEVLSYFNKAEYVIADTFHGTVLSIKYNKQFAVFIRDGKNGAGSNRNKLCFLLKFFSLENREIQNADELEGVLKKPINFEGINKIIKFETQSALEYLDKNLSGFSGDTEVT